MALERGPLLADDALRGASWCRAHSDLVDAWLASLFADAVGDDDTGLALVAVGGYGRAELCPHSDIDLMLVHDRRRDIATIADRVWYPIWDQGLHLGHSVCTVGEALELAADDLDTATAILSARAVAGRGDLAEQLARRAHDQWQRKGRRWLSELSVRVEQRHATAGEVAFLLEPDLKEGRGGLRDVHSLRWAEATGTITLDHDATNLANVYAVLLDARVELQRVAGRPTNLLAVQEQPAVARALGDASADALMARVAVAARAIAWTSDEIWRQTNTTTRIFLRQPKRRSQPVGPDLALKDGEVILADSAVALDDPCIALRVAVAAARHDAAIERHSLERLASETPPMSSPWPSEGRQLLADLLLFGPSTIRAIEALDQRNIWTRLLPEWLPVRSMPQHNALHRFTVDRHLLETASQAAQLASRVKRADLLVVAALLHDLGKGVPDADHTEAGVKIITAIATRAGFDADDVDTLAALVQHHLLLADVVARRDLNDPATITRVARDVGSVERLHLLAALTEADSIGTGPAAWGQWKADLVAQLVQRVEHVLEGGDVGKLISAALPTDETLARLAGPGTRIDVSNDVVTVMTDDRPGVFSRVAGVLTLHGLDVLSASAYSSEDGRAMAEFRVTDPFRDHTPWDKVTADLTRALAGMLALNARVAERSRTYMRTRRPALDPLIATVAFDNAASDDATVIDVQAPDKVGVLYRITRALAELDLDIRSARVQTMGSHVIDAFYVRDRSGDKLTDPQTLAEVERAVVHSLSEG